MRCLVNSGTLVNLTDEQLWHIDLPVLTSSESRMGISQLLLTSSDQEWQFHTATDI